MPTRSRTRAGRRIGYLRRLWWETVRRHPEYRRDVACFLRSLRAGTAGQRRPTDTSISGRSLSPLPPLSAILATPDEEPSALFDSLTTVRAPDATFRRVQAAHEALGLYSAMCNLARREPTADLSVVYLVRSRVELPELAAFEAKWRLRFPVPPRAERTPERLMCAPITHPVRIVSDGPSDLVLDLWRPAGMAVLDHVAGMLDQYQEHRDDVLPAR